MSDQTPEESGGHPQPQPQVNLQQKQEKSMTNENKQDSSGSVSNAAPFHGRVINESSQGSMGLADVAGNVIDQAMDDPRQLGSSNLGIYFMAGVVFLAIGVGFHTYQEMHSHAMKPPKLAHVVQEYQGWRKPNMLAFGVTVVMGLIIVGSLNVYRRMRAERARGLDSTYWGLVTFTGFMFVAWIFKRKRARERNALMRAMKAAGKNQTYLKEKLIFAAVVLLSSWLLWYRRKMHLRHLAKKKARHDHALHGDLVI